jgi:hypothetical protein
MIRQFQLRSLAVAVGLAGLIMAAVTDRADARGRGGFPHGGFSREGAAAGGSFASRSGFMAGHERGFESGARGAEFGRMGEANRFEQGAGMANAEHAIAGHPLEANREQAAKALQNNAQQYHRVYPYAGAAAAWDAGAAAATTGAAAAWGAAAGAATGSAAAASAAPPASAPAYTAQPCANAVSFPVGPLTFFRCGTAWYRQAYGPGGPTFVQVARPGL